MTDAQPAEATTLLREEHKLILEVANALAGMLAAETDGTSLDYDAVSKCATFLRPFAVAWRCRGAEAVAYAISAAISLQPRISWHGLPSASEARVPQ